MTLFKMLQKIEFRDIISKNHHIFTINLFTESEWKNKGGSYI